MQSIEAFSSKTLLCQHFQHLSTQKQLTGSQLRLLWRRITWEGECERDVWRQSFTISSIFQTENFNIYLRTYAVPIPGETKRIIHISEVKCNAFGCSHSECFGFHHSHVDVRNTFGNRRSGAIIPNIVRHAFISEGMKWLDHACVFVEG